MTAIQNIFCVAVFFHRSVQNFLWNIYPSAEIANQIWGGKLFPGGPQCPCLICLWMSTDLPCCVAAFQLVYPWWLVLRVCRSPSACLCRGFLELGSPLWTWRTVYQPGWCFWLKKCGRHSTLKHMKQMLSTNQLHLQYLRYHMLVSTQNVHYTKIKSHSHIILCLKGKFSSGIEF